MGTGRKQPGSGEITKSTVGAKQVVPASSDFEASPSSEGDGVGENGNFVKRGNKGEAGESFASPLPEEYLWQFA